MIGLQVAIVIVGLKQFEDSPVEVELTQNCDCEREVLDLLDYNLNVSTVVESSQFCSTLNSTSTLNGSSTLMEVAVCACVGRLSVCVHVNMFVCSTSLAE